MHTNHGLAPAIPEQHTNDERVQRIAGRLLADMSRAEQSPQFSGASSAFKRRVETLHNALTMVVGNEIKGFETKFDPTKDATEYSLVVDNTILKFTTDPTAKQDTVILGTNITEIGKPYFQYRFTSFESGGRKTAIFDVGENKSGKHDGVKYGTVVVPL